MITPSYGLTATERVLPRLALNFTTASLDPRVTFTRTGNTATVTNSSGVIVGINADLPRFDYDPTTLVCKGLLIEEARTNLLLNSLINGDSLVTQLVTTTAVAHTLSFYGTGTIVLTGTSSATVVGTGAYPSRTTLTFTPTAGVLTVTVTGTVQFAQLETGVFATSYIPTAASQVTRNADVATITGANFTSWYNPSEGAFTFKYAMVGVKSTASQRVLQVDDNTETNRIANFLTTGNGLQTTISIAVGNTGSFSPPATTVVPNTFYTQATAYKVNNCQSAVNAATGVIDTSVDIPTVTTLRIASSATGVISSCLHISYLYYWPQRLITAELAAFTK